MGRVDPHIRDALLAHLRTHHPGTCRHWFDDIELVEITGGTMKLLVREAVQLKYLQRCCMEQFKEAAQAATGKLVAVRFVGDEDDGETAEGGTRPRSEFISDDEMLLSPDYSFANFVIGPENRLAHAAAIAVSQKPGRAYNPLFIHGGVGLGKTHLLHAICQAAMNVHRGMRIHYISCNGFMTQFLDSVQAGQMAEFRQKWRSIDLLVMDDVHDLAKRDRTQEEFFHTFNTLYQTGRQIVLSSDSAPSEIPDVEERLSSRFNCGLVARIEKPGYETRVAIIKSKAAMRSVVIPDEVVGYIAARIDSNIRELEGAITSLQSLSLVNNCSIDQELAKQAIGDRGNGKETANPSIQTILSAITNFYDIRLSDLLGKRRHKSVAMPRQVAMWLARRHTRFSLDEIGSYFGGRDHTTVLHAVKSIDHRRDEDAGLSHEVSRLEERILGSEPARRAPDQAAPDTLPPV
jgi:chromosomal replication initiator protein